MRRLLVPLALLAVSLAQAPVWAADVPATSIIDAVTVFPQGAEVTRTTKVTLPAGDNVVVLKDLPADLVGESIRIQGEATGKVEIGSVDLRQFYLAEEANSGFDNSTRKRLQEELERLGDERQGLQNTIDAATVQKQLIGNLALLPTHEQGSSQAAPPPVDWGLIFTTIGQRLAEANKTIMDAQVAMRAVDRKIADVQNQLNQEPQREERRSELKIHVGVQAPLEATLRIRYQVPAAYWTPIYDARLESGDGSEAPKLALVRRAIVTQQTGEDWNDVLLSLSTTRPQAGTAAPDITPVAVEFMEAVSGEGNAAPMRSKSVGGEAERGVVMDQMAEAPASEPPAPAAKPVLSVEQKQAETVTSLFQALYIVADRQTIKNNVGDKRVQIDVKSLEPTLSVRTVPKFSESAYLYAKFKLEPDMLFLPGSTSVFRDGVFVGNGYLPQLAGGEEHELGFGVDDKVRVKFINLGRKSGETGLISTSKTDTQSFKVTIKNLHGRAIPVHVIDQVPVSENDQIKVELLATTTPPSVKDLDDKRGVLAWHLKLEPDQEQEIAFGYLVSWPNGKEIVYSPRPGPWPIKQQ